MVISQGKSFIIFVQIDFFNSNLENIIKVLDKDEDIDMIFEQIF